LEPADFARRLRQFLVEAGSLPADVDDETWSKAAELVQTRIVVLGDAWGLLRFLFVDEADFELDEKSAGKHLKADARPVVEAAIGALRDVDRWSTENIETALKAALVEGLGIKPRKAFGPVRVAVTGSHVSPPLFESMELLGRERSL